jgi:hypothetical protein
MEKEFIPYKEAVALKELGFNEPCLAKYAIYNPKDPIALFPQSQDFFKGYFNYYKNSDYTDKTAAPTFSQAFRWFREKYGLDVISKPHIGKTKKYICDPVNIRLEAKNTYEEAELACLLELINICKKK